MLQGMPFTVLVFGVEFCAVIDLGRVAATEFGW